MGRQRHYWPEEVCRRRGTRPFPFKISYTFLLLFVRASPTGLHLLKHPQILTSESHHHPLSRCHLNLLMGFSASKLHYGSQSVKLLSLLLKTTARNVVMAFHVTQIKANSLLGTSKALHGSHTTTHTPCSPMSSPDAATLIPCLFSNQVLHVLPEGHCTCF